MPWKNDSRNLKFHIDAEKDLITKFKVVKLAYIIFDDITWLDFIGVYDPISRLKTLNYLTDLSWDICSHTDSIVSGSR